MGKVLHRFSVPLSSGKELPSSLGLGKLLAEGLSQNLEDTRGRGPLGSWPQFDLLLGHTLQVEDQGVNCLTVRLAPYSPLRIGDPVLQHSVIPGSPVLAISSLPRNGHPDGWRGTGRDYTGPGGIWLCN